MNDDIGWRLTIADAVKESRRYMLEVTADGGVSWDVQSNASFGGEWGAAEGLMFFDESFGFAGLTGKTQESSSLFVTEDGGKTFNKVYIPTETAGELPETAAKYQHTGR